MIYQPLITEIKGHSLDDGKGIRSVIFFKGCPLACVWCHNPETINPEATLSYDAKACLNIGDCASECPQNAIDLSNTEFVNRDLCNLCGKCEEACVSEAISIVGKAMSVDDVVNTIKRYQPFFESSGGGVTLSGGEATLYMDYCELLLQSLKALNIQVVLETSGYFNLDRFLEKMYPYLDQIYFDIKLIDSEQHKRFCGKTNETVLRNFASLQRKARLGGVPVLARVPLIPEVTATKDNLTGIANFLKSLGEDKVALLPYNPLWLEKADKIDKMGQCGEYVHAQWLPEESINECRSYFDGFKLEGAG